MILGQFRIAQKMQMQIRHQRVLADVEHQLVIGNPLLQRKCPRLFGQHAGKICSLGCEMSNGLGKSLGNEEEMQGRLRMNVFDDENVSILVENCGRKFLVENLVKNGAWIHRKLVGIGNLTQTLTPTLALALYLFKLTF